MIIPSRVFLNRIVRQIPVGRLLLILAVFATQTGCATSDADLDYTRQTAPDPAQDHSFHGWNNANN